MIKVDWNKGKGTVRVKGTTDSLLAEFTLLCKSFKEEGCLGFESEEDLKKALHDAVDFAFRPTESILAEIFEKLAVDLKELSAKGNGEE